MAPHREISFGVVGTSSSNIQLGSRGRWGGATKVQDPPPGGGGGIEARTLQHPPEARQEHAPQARVQHTLADAGVLEVAEDRQPGL